MVRYKTLTGEWTKIDDKFKGLIDATLTARYIGGSEEDTNYEVYAIVKIIDATKASIIVAFTYSEDWDERYIEMVLKPAENKVTLEAVNGASRNIIASRNFTLDLNTEYKCRVRLKGDTITGYIDVFELVRADDLATLYQAGMHGLQTEGSEGKCSEFSNVQKVVAD